MKCKGPTFAEAVKMVYNGEDPEIIALFMLGEPDRVAQDLRDGAEEYAIELEAAKRQYPKNWKRSF